MKKLTKEDINIQKLYKEGIESGIPKKQPSIRDIIKSLESKKIKK